MNQSQNGTQEIYSAALIDQNTRMNSADRIRKMGRMYWAAPTGESLRMSSADQRQKAREMC